MSVIRPWYRGLSPVADLHVLAAKLDAGLSGIEAIKPALNDLHVLF